MKRTKTLVKQQTDVTLKSVDIDSTLTARRVANSEKSRRGGTEENLVTFNKV